MTSRTSSDGPINLFAMLVLLPLEIILWGIVFAFQLALYLTLFLLAAMIKSSR
jgi:hypothetical protein